MSSYVKYPVPNQSDGFTIIQPDFGTSPTAVSPNSALTLTSADGTVVITGNATTNTIDFSAPGAGTVSSVGLALPVSVFQVTGSPVTSSGTLTGSFVSQAQNLVFASPNGSSGVPVFRALVAGDLPASLYISRVILSVSSPTTLGSASNTDYVYLVSGNTAVTLPTAVSNTNRYTIKNTGTGTVVVQTTSSQTIDASNSASLPVQYTSLDLISNGSNWNVI